jgi:hypothetical protein
MLAFVVGNWCIRTKSGALCPAGTKIVPPFIALVAAFVLIGMVGVIYLAIRGRRG